MIHLPGLGLCFLPGIRFSRARKGSLSHKVYPMLLGLSSISGVLGGRVVRYLLHFVHHLDEPMSWDLNGLGMYIEILGRLIPLRRRSLSSSVQTL